VNQLDAYRLLQEGAEALSFVEEAGFRIDLEYCQEKLKWIDHKLQQAELRLKRSELGKAWQARYGSAWKHASQPQLKHILYQDMRVKAYKQSGEESTDEESLLQTGVDGAQHVLTLRRFKKARDVLYSLIRYSIEGRILPSYLLHTVQTYRSCVAKGSKVLVVRDFLTHPDGIPIEDVRKGDYVYCFDDNLNPAIRKVLWSGKTGHKKVVRLHWSERGNHGKGYVDVTPDHLIRLIDGSYVQAQHLHNADFRKSDESHHLPKVRVLSCSRVNDSLRFTGHLKHGNGIHEHRFVYKNFIDELQPSEIVHHKNKVHLDHNLDNLDKMSQSDHAKLHDCFTNEGRRKARESLRRRIETEGGASWMRGDSNGRWISLSKFTFIRMLAQAKGKIYLTGLDFSTVHSRAKLFGIDLEHVRDRYDLRGEYVSLGKLKKMQPIKLSQMGKYFGFNYNKSKRMLSKRGFTFVIPKPASNPYGRRGLPGNHTITKVEWINEPVDVYDLEVEEFNNFFANEICVHNSCAEPNLQNVPKRDKEIMDICRRAFIPSHGHRLMEIDFSGIEVGIAATYHKDPVMLKYLNDPSSDMHSDMAQEIFILPRLNQSLKKLDGGDTLRQSAKNGFVFPQFYGDYFVACAFNIACSWCKLPQSGVWKPDQGIVFNGKPIVQHLLEKDIDSLDVFTSHMEKVEKNFWNRRFKVYNEWRKSWYAEYQKTGEFEMKTGFKVSGLLHKNQVINYPVQGSAFHCLLKSLIQMVSRMKGWKSKVIGEIHDSMIIDAHPSEIDDICALAQKICTEELPADWPWIIVPMRVEIAASEIDGNWSEMKVLVQ
jgi:hypothetical protein